MTNQPVTVVYRVFHEGDVIALFPDTQEAPGFIGSYQHAGQHGAASEELRRELRPATAEERAPLHAELLRIGYALRAVE